MKKLYNPKGNEGKFISALISGVILTMKPGEERVIDDTTAEKAHQLYPFLVMSECEEEPAEAPQPTFNGEKKPRRKFFNL